MSLILRMIFRYALKRVINYFAFFVIFFSIGSLFTINAVLKGFEAKMENVIRGSKADWSLRFIFPPADGESVINNLPSGFTSSPILQSWAIIESPMYTTLIQLKGVDPKQEVQFRKAMQLPDLGFDQLSDTHQNSGESQDVLDSMFGLKSGNPKPAIVAELLAEKLQLEIGDSFKVKTIDHNQKLAQQSFEVSDLFKTGLYEEDTSLIFIQIEDAKNLLGLQGEARTYQLTRQPENGLEREELTKAFPEADLSAWYDQNIVHLEALRHQRITLAIILTLFIAFSSFGILAIQWNFIQEKTSDIGILRATGFSSSDILVTFLGVSYVVGLSALVAGLFGGLLLTQNINGVLNVIQSLIGWHPFPSNIYYHEGLPVHIEFYDMLWIGAMSFIVTTIAGFIPAWRATHIEPIQAIGRI